MSRWFREAALWVGAALGVLAMVGAVAVIGFGYTFLIFRSGSMAPEIPTGSIALARSVDAERIEKGDVVSVETASGTRVTHRVVTAKTSEGNTTLTLKGDANQAPDDELYPVDSADRVIGSVPMVGYAVAWLLSPPGLLVAGGLGAVLVLLGLRSDRDDTPRGSPQRRRDIAAVRRRAGRGRATMASVACATVVVTGVTVTDAYFTDNATGNTSTATSARYFTCAAAMGTAANGGLGPWAWYKMDETSGNLVDSSGNGITATWRNAVGLQRGQTRACGRDTGTSISLGGNTTGLNGNYASTANIVTQQGVAGARWNTFTISVWFKTATASSTGKLLAMGGSQTGASTSYDRHLMLTANGSVLFGVYNGATQEIVTTGTDYSDQQWHMATASLSSSGMKLYVDGQLLKTNTGVTTAEQYAAMYWRVGYENTSGQGGAPQPYFGGQMDEAGIWTRALTDAEVLNLYRSGEPNA